MPYNSCRTCLTNHIGSISCHIIPLVITSLGGRDTQTHIATICTGSILRNKLLKYGTETMWNTNLSLKLHFKLTIMLNKWTRQCLHTTKLTKKNKLVCWIDYTLQTLDTCHLTHCHSITLIYKQFKLSNQHHFKQQTVLIIISCYCPHSNNSKTSITLNPWGPL